MSWKGGPGPGGDLDTGVGIAPVAPSVSVSVSESPKVEEKASPSEDATLHGCNGEGGNTECCPQCRNPYNTGDHRKLIEFCGHFQCRRCAFEEGRCCIQCDATPQVGLGEGVIEVGEEKVVLLPQPPHELYYDYPDLSASAHQMLYVNMKKSAAATESCFRVEGEVVDVIERYSSIVGEDSERSRASSELGKEDGMSVSQIVSIGDTNTPSTSTPEADLTPESPLEQTLPSSYSVPPTPPTSVGEEEDDHVESDPGEGGPVPEKKKKRSSIVIPAHITILGGDPVMYQCQTCTKKFKTKPHVKYHEFCQQEGDKPFKCETCGQGFIAKSHYEYHIRNHTGERPYTCPKCGKGFNQQGKVTRHMRSHTGEKPFVCQECNRGFANAQALRCHTLIHTGERSFACTYCNKRFTGMTNLKKHVITHAGERPFSCTHCGKSFGLKWTLDLHLRTHSTERPYACDQCTRAFSNSKDLRRHLVIHLGERPFKCWICGTAFRRKDNLDRHIKNTHNQPKEVAKQLANEAAAEYLKNNSKNQSLGNIPVSKVNSIVM